MKLNPYTLAIAAGGVALLLAALLVWRKGGVAGAAAAVGGAAVDAAGGLARGAVDTAGAAVGLPSTDETTQDAAVARWIIDTHGYWQASQWAGVPALAKALTMDAGSGRPPPPGSALAAALPAPAAAAAPAPAQMPAARMPWTDIGDASFADLSAPAGRYYGGHGS